MDQITEQVTTDDGVEDTEATICWLGISKVAVVWEELQGGEVWASADRLSNEMLYECKW